MDLEKTAIEEVLTFTPKRHGAVRRFLSETWNRRRMEDAGIHLDFVQDIHCSLLSTGRHVGC